jgi:hypothetical protein
MDLFSCWSLHVHAVQAAVAVLLARKASPAMRTWPSAGGPPLTPADMAAAAGHAGLAALLAEAQLHELLAGLKSNSRRQGAHEVLTGLVNGSSAAKAPARDYAIAGSTLNFLVIDSLCSTGSSSGRRQAYG